MMWSQSPSECPVRTTRRSSTSRARNDGLLITEDKDFGQLVFAAAKENSGVILIRYPASARSALTSAILKFLSDNAESLYSRFAVLEPGRARVTRLVT